MIHAGVLPFWLIGFLIAFPLTWLELNDIAWRAGHGALLTERPIASAHHRIMGTIQDFENAGDDIGYYEGHLGGYPNATSEARAEWQRHLDRAQHQQRLILFKSTLTALLAYLPVGFILDRWHQADHWTDELAIA